MVSKTKLTHFTSKNILILNIDETLYYALEFWIAKKKILRNLPSGQECLFPSLIFQVQTLGLALT